jgi:hypothetical protein
MILSIRCALEWPWRMTSLSDRQSDAFDNPAKTASRQGNLRVLREVAYRAWEQAVTMSKAREVRFMSSTITGVVTNGVIVPSSPLPEGARVAIHLLADDVPSANPLLHFSGHLDPNDPVEQEFVKELARRRREDLEQTLREDGQECSTTSSTPIT